MLIGLLSGYQAAGETEAADLERMRRLAATAPDPWSRSLPLHLTASALVVHLETRRVLLRWHVRHGRWLQVGGHGDPGETDPLKIALREASEETGLTDLVPWPDESLRHVVVCHVPPSATEPEHEHADLRFFLATGSPDSVAPENERSPLRWLSIDEARELVSDNNLRHALDRADALLAVELDGCPGVTSRDPRTWYLALIPSARDQAGNDGGRSRGDHCLICAISPASQATASRRGGLCARERARRMSVQSRYANPRLRVLRPYVRSRKQQVGGAHSPAKERI